MLFVCTGTIGNLSLNSGSAMFQMNEGSFWGREKLPKFWIEPKKGASVFAANHEMTCRISSYIEKQNGVLSYRN